MSRRRFFAPPGAIEGGIARLSEDELHHLRDVLRLRPGAEVELFDGEGNAYAAVVGGRAPRLYLERLERIDGPAESPLDVTLALALIKTERFEWALEKATELGVRAVVPLRTRYVEARDAGRGLQARLERWRRIVLEAAKQSRRARLPEVSSPQAVGDFLSAAPPSTTTVFFSEGAAAGWNGSVGGGRAVRLVVGPEGGWDEDEVAAASRAGCRICGLGHRILRAETAAIAAVALAQFVAGDLGAGRG